MSSASESTAQSIYDLWHRYIHERDIDGLMSLYADDAVLESTAILVLERNATGLLKGKDLLRSHFSAFFEMLPAKPIAEWYRPGPPFIGNDTLVWEYPGEGPAGPQFDVVESMTLRDGVVAYHRVYWGWRSSQALMQKLDAATSHES